MTSRSPSLVVALCLTAALASKHTQADVSLTFGAKNNESKEISQLIIQKAKEKVAIDAFAHGDVCLREQFPTEAYKIFNDVTACRPIGTRRTYYAGKAIDSLGIKSVALEIYDVGTQGVGIYLQRKAAEEMVAERRAKLDKAEKPDAAKEKAAPDPSSKSTENVKSASSSKAAPTDGKSSAVAKAKQPPVGDAKARRRSDRSSILLCRS
jgi:hypothetical protein